MKAEIVKHYRINPDKIKVIYHGINRKYFQDIDVNTITTILHKYRIKGDYILTIGNLHPRRNLRAFNRGIYKTKNENNTVNQLKLVLVKGGRFVETIIVTLWHTK